MVVNETIMSSSFLIGTFSAITGSDFITCLILMFAIIICLAVIKANSYTTIGISMLAAFGLATMGLGTGYAYAISALLGGIVWYFLIKNLIQ